MGCGLTEGDFKDKTSLLKACKGCDVVISTVSSTLSRQEGDNIQTVDQEGNLNLIAAAKEAGIKQFIFISFRHKNATDNPLTAAKRSAEKAIISSGMTYTILQASNFMEIWLSPALGFNYHDHTAQIPGDGNQLISYVSYKDVAAFTVASVDSATTKNKTLEIGGPEAISPAQVIKEFEKIGKHPFNVTYIPVAALQKQADEATDYWQKIFSNVMIFYANGDAIDMKPVLEKIPVKLHSVREYAKAVLKKEEAVA
jgi:uncharacterized protein YbjT (DUF2867 family)